MLANGRVTLNERHFLFMSNPLVQSIDQKRNWIAKTHLSIQPTALSVVHYNLSQTPNGYLADNWGNRATLKTSAQYSPSVCKLVKDNTLPSFGFARSAALQSHEYNCPLPCIRYTKRLMMIVWKETVTYEFPLLTLNAAILYVFVHYAKA